MLANNDKINKDSGNEDLGSSDSRFPNTDKKLKPGTEGQRGNMPGGQANPIDKSADNKNNKGMDSNVGRDSNTKGTPVRDDSDDK